MAITPARVLEALAFAMGLMYAVLAVRQNRFCWVGGGIASAILAYLAATARLPMQAGLQVYYVAMAVYGFWRWSDRTQHGRLITTWPPWAHVLAIAVVFAGGALTARLLAAETEAAWPFLDAVTTWASLLATWMVAQVKLENWLYWIVTDLALAVLFAAQELHIAATLYLVYLGIAAVGFVTWRRRYLAQRSTLAQRSIA